MIVIGSGSIETQPLLAATVLPTSSVIVTPSSNTSSTNTSTSETPITSAKTVTAAQSGASAVLVPTSGLFLFFLLAWFILFA